MHDSHIISQRAPGVVLWYQNELVPISQGVFAPLTHNGIRSFQVLGMSMKKLLVRLAFVFLAAFVLNARPGQWNEQDVRDAVERALSAPDLPRAAQVVGVRVDDAVISLNLSPEAASPAALRNIVSALTRLPGEAGRLKLEIRIGGKTARRASTMKLSQQSRPSRDSAEPQSPLLFLNHDSDATGVASSIRSVLAGQGLEILSSADLESGAVASTEPAVSLALQATPGSGAAVIFSKDETREFAESLQTAIPGARLIECEACSDSVTLELGDTANEPSSRMEAGLALRQALKPLAASDRSASKAEMTSPAPGATLSGATVTFQWAEGTDATNYWLMVGTWVGGNTIYSSDQGTLTSATVTTLPVDGRTIYVRLWSYINKQWVSNDYQYTAFSSGGSTPVKAAITSPTPGSTLSGPSATFQWNTGTGASRYYLFAGSWTGGNTIFSQDMATSTQATISNLPVDGSTIYIRLWSYINNTWDYNDYTYKASGTVTAAKAAITSPAPGAALPGSSTTFQWNAGAGVTRYFLFVGRWQGGSTFFSQDMGTNLSAAVSGLPSDGSTVYVRLWSYINNAWQYNDYTFTAAGTAPTPVKGVITSPASGSTLSGSSATFTWTPGSAIQRFWLFVGTAVGNNDVYGGDQGTNTSATVGGLPTNGKPLYVRLWSYINGAWQYSDAQYKAAGQ